MERIENQINLLSTQIEAVSSEIKTVESILENDFNKWLKNHWGLILQT
jgi:archaellum component FlaC